MKSKVLVLLFIAATPGLARQPFNDIDKKILDAGKSIEHSFGKVGKEAERSVEYNKALSICQEKCPVCFDGISCDFDCAKKECINSPREEK